MTEPLLTSRQVAKRLGVTVTTVNRWAVAGQLPAAQIVPGYLGARLYAAADVEKLEAERAA